MIRIELDRVQGDFGFEARDAGGHKLNMDGSPEIGGGNTGARPMQLLLAALGGCSGIDIVSILKKQRQEADSIRMIIEGERESGKEPSLWKKVNVIFEFTGSLDPEKARRACALSIDKYCSVAETLRRGGTEITWQARVNNEVISESEA